MGREGHFEGPPGEEPSAPKVEAVVESPEITAEALDQLEQEIDAIAAQALEGNQEITRRLLALGATNTEVGQVLQKTSEVDREIEDTRDSYFSRVMQSLETLYRQNIERVDRSIVAEFSLRPIHKKYSSLNAGLALTVGIDNNLDEAATTLFKTDSQVRDHYHPLYKSVVVDTRKFIKHISYRRYAETLRLQYPHYGLSEDVSDMRVLHAILLDEMKSPGQDPKEFQERFDVFFEPSPVGYVNSKSIKVFDEASGDPRNNYRLLPMLERMRAFNHHVLQNESIGPDIPKSILQSKVVDILEDERNMQDIFKDPSSLQDVRLFIESSDFNDGQQRLIYDRLFSAMARHPQALHFFGENPDFPYTKEQGGIIVDLLGKGGLSDQEFAAIVGNEKITSSPELKAKACQATLERLSSKLTELSGQSSYHTVLSFTEQITYFAEKSLLDAEQQKALSLRADESFLLSVDTFLGTYTSGAGFDINRLSSFLEDVARLPEKYTSAVQEKVRAVPWCENVSKILSMYQHSRRLEYDRWHTDIGPLAATMVTEGVLNVDKKEDSRLFLEYIKNIGPNNLPNYFRLFANIKRNASITDIPEALKTKIHDAFDIDVDVLCEKEPTNTNLILHEIEKYRQGIAHRLIREDVSVIDEVLRSEYSREFFSYVKGNSGFNQGGTLDEVLKAYQKNYAEHPERFRVPDGYYEKRISVSEYTIRESPDVEKQSSDIMQNPDLVTYHERVFHAAQVLSDGTSTFQEKIDLIHERIVSEARQQLEGTIERIASEQSRDQRNDKALIGLEARKKASENLVQQLGALDVRKKTAPEIMEVYGMLLPDDLSSKQEACMMLSLADMAERFKDQVEKVIDADAFPEKPTINTVRFLNDFVGSYVRGHYLDKKHGEAEAIAVSDKKTLRYLKKIWGTQDFENGILATSDAKLNSIEKGEVSSKKRTITLIPSKGMQRVFSGDLGHACTSNRNLELAKGDYEHIVSYSLVIDKDTPAERFAGSFLVIETTTDQNEPILVIRANNPAQNLAQLDTDGLIEQILGSVKEVAKARGIPNVGVAHEFGSASNRSYVVDYYAKSFSLDNAIQLKKTRETTFNNYPIYDKKGGHPTVMI